MEIDLLGLNKGAAKNLGHEPTPMSNALTVRSLAQTGGEMNLDYTTRTSLPPNSRAREMLRSALLSPTLEDSDVFLVLHGLGGAAREGKEVATGMVNLEELLASGYDVSERWVDLHTPEQPTGRPIGRILVHVVALEALLSIKKELDEALAKIARLEKKLADAVSRLRAEP